MNGPGVSVVIPMYNGERYIAEAIESGAAMGFEPSSRLVRRGVVDRVAPDEAPTLGLRRQPGREHERLERPDVR